MCYIHGKSIIKVAVADDQEMIREFLSSYIDTIENCKVVIQASNGKELLEKLLLKPNTDLVLLDIAMPEMDGYETAKNLRLKYPRIKILFCSTHNSELAICQMIGAGGNGFIDKGSSSSELKKALFNTMRNDYNYPYCSNTINNTKNNYQLSEKETHFMKLICTERTYKHIAADLFLNERQVDYIREGLFLKFCVHSRVGLALISFQSGVFQIAAA